MTTTWDTQIINYYNLLPDTRKLACSRMTLSTSAAMMAIFTRNPLFGKKEEKISTKKDWDTQILAYYTTRTNTTDKLPSSRMTMATGDSMMAIFNKDPLFGTLYKKDELITEGLSLQISSTNSKKRKADKIKKTFDNRTSIIYSDSDEEELRAKETKRLIREEFKSTENENKLSYDTSFEQKQLMRGENIPMQLTVDIPNNTPTKHQEILEIQNPLVPQSVEDALGKMVNHTHSGMKITCSALFDRISEHSTVRLKNANKVAQDILSNFEIRTRLEDDDILRTPKYTWERPCCNGKSCQGYSTHGDILVEMLPKKLYYDIMNKYQQDHIPPELPSKVYSCLRCVRYQHTFFIKNTEAEKIKHDPTVVPSTFWYLIGKRGEYDIVQCMFTSPDIYQGTILGLLPECSRYYERFVDNDENHGPIVYHQQKGYLTPEVYREYQNFQNGAVLQLESNQANEFQV